MSIARPNTWMPIFWADYWADTGHLSAAEHGAYLNLIGRYWVSGGPLPDDDKALARMAGMTPAEWRKARPTIRKFFEVKDGVWRKGRIDRELQRAADNVESKRQNGQKGGRPPKPKDNRNETQTKPSGFENGNLNHNRTETPPPPPLSGREGKSSSGISPPAASAAPTEPPTDDDGSPATQRSAEARAIIAEFDASRTAVYGPEQARPWPNSTDFPTACRWIDAGAGPDLCRAVFDALNAKLQARGHRPRDLLRAFDSDVLRAVEMARDPLKFPADPRSSDDKSPRFCNGWLQLAAELAAERDAPDPDPLALP